MEMKKTKFQETKRIFLLSKFFYCPNQFWTEIGNNLINDHRRNKFFNKTFIKRPSAFLDNLNKFEPILSWNKNVKKIFLSVLRRTCKLTKNWPKLDQKFAKNPQTRVFFTSLFETNGLKLDSNWNWSLSETGHWVEVVKKIGGQQREKRPKFHFSRTHWQINLRCRLFSPFFSPFSLLFFLSSSFPLLQVKKQRNEWRKNYGQKLWRKSVDGPAYE